MRYEPTEAALELAHVRDLLRQAHTALRAIADAPPAEPTGVLQHIAATALRSTGGGQA